MLWPIVVTTILGKYTLPTTSMLGPRFVFVGSELFVESRWQRVQRLLKLELQTVCPGAQAMQALLNLQPGSVTQINPVFVVVCADYAAGLLRRSGPALTWCCKQAPAAAFG